MKRNTKSDHEDSLASEDEEATMKIIEAKKFPSRLFDLVSK